MNETQIAEIRNYLLSKKLPIDILMEVQDHFVSQIQDLEKEENLSFEKAFEKTKENWKRDLTLSWNKGFDLNNTTLILRKVRREIEKANVLFVLKYGTIFILLILFSGEVLEPIYFKYFSLFIFAVLILFPAVNYLANLKDFRLAKKYDNYVLTLYQTGVIFFISASAIVFQFLDKFYENSEKIQQLIHFQKVDFSFWRYLILILGLLSITYGNLYSWISQKKYLQQIEKIKPFLKYLRTSN